MFLFRAILIFYRNVRLRTAQRISKQVTFFLWIYGLNSCVETVTKQNTTLTLLFIPPNNILPQLNSTFRISCYTSTIFSFIPLFVPCFTLFDLTAPWASKLNHNKNDALETLMTFMSRILVLVTTYWKTFKTFIKKLSTD